MRSHIRAFARPACVAVAAAVPLAVSVGMASATPPSVSYLQVRVPPSTSPTTTLTIDGNVATTAVVNVKLDGNCPAVYGAGQKYGIAAISDHTAVAKVSPASKDGLKCGSAATAFTITGVGNGGADITFDPVAKTQGLQKKLGGVVLHVTVKNISGSSNNGGGPPGHKRPAAPAVANAYLGNSATLVTACQTKYGHNWRGAVITQVAHWSAAGKWSTKKDNLTLFPTDDSWVQKVQGVVNTLC